MGANARRALFVYGSLRPGQLAHNQIKDLIEPAEPACAQGFGLWVRDGLPYIAPADAGVVRGDLLRPKYGQDEEVYRRVRLYEGDDLYSERSLTVRCASGEQVQATAFVGRRVGRGNPEARVHGEWTADTDPLFVWGLDSITDAARALLKPIDGIPLDVGGPVESREFWDAFVPLQGLYLVLCSVLERYTTLAFGSGLEPGERLTKLAEDDDAAKAVARAQPSPFKVLDSRNSASPKSVSAGRPFIAWYQARGNLTHRGKGARHDYILLADALVGLHDALRFLLALKLTPGSTDRFAPPGKLLRDSRPPQSAHV